MNKLYIKNRITGIFIKSVLIIAGLLISNRAFPQVPTCGSNVPFYSVNLTGSPGGTWYSPAHSRVGNCCGTTSPDNCTSFQIIVDTGTAMISFGIASGAMPGGAMFYQINCGPPQPVGTPICLSGPGPHNLTFCKPGNNQNTYYLQAIPKPTIPSPQYVRIGCTQTLHIMGFDSTSVTWTSIYPGTTGQYNSYLSCTSGCQSPVYTPALSAPPYIDYKICGTPIATACGYVATCATVRIYNEPTLTGSVTPNPAVFCASGSGVLLTATGSGGYGGYTYIWRDQTNTIVGTGSTYNATATGTYAVEIRDSLYSISTCPSIFISVPVSIANVPVVSAGVDQTLCPASPTAYLNGSVLYAPGGIWTGGAGTFNPNNTNMLASYTPTASEIASGIVTLTLTSTGAGGGCTNSSDVVVLHYPPQLTITLPSTTVACSNGTAVLTPTVTGGSVPYTYLWNTSATTSSIVAGQGNYCVSITDDIGCNMTQCANVIAPSPLTLSMSSTIVSVNGGSDGTASATAGGGAGPYTYSWSPGGQTTQTITGCSFGIYTCTVTDANGCSINASVVVNEPQCSAFTGTTSVNNLLCFGDLNGSASVTPSGGTGPYSYVWNDPLHQTTATASGLAAGTYVVVVTDKNKCLYCANIIITEPTQLTNVMNQTNVTVIGGNNGSATSNPFGGTPGYNYSWSNGGTTQTIGSLYAGTYILNLSDNNNCHLIDSVKITEGPCQNLIISASSNNVSCAGGNNGSATVVALHGSPPYSYSWSNGATTATVNNLTAGNYVVVVTDAINCSTFKNITISEPPALSIGLSPKPVSCFGQNNGTIELTVSGGNFPYSFAWSNGITVEDLINLSNGTYSITVTDAKGCTASGSTSIWMPSELNLNSTSHNVTCYGGSDGSINITTNGGISPYSYQWNNGSSSQNLSGLSVGQYSVVVTDANGCTASIPLGIIIDQPDSVSMLSYTVSCPAPGSGVSLVTVTPTGGWTSPYQISFDNGVTFQTAGDYDALLPVNATYTVVILDKNNCSSLLPIIIHVNPEPAISFTAFSKCFYGATTAGTVTITPTGGNSGPYSVSLDGGATYSPAGTYTFSIPVDSSYNVVIKDGDLCTSLSSTISLPAVLASTSAVSSYNGYNISCAGLSNGSVTLTTTGGIQPYSFSWSNSTTTQNQTGIAAGNYSVVVTDANNCKDTLNFNITEPQVLTSTITAASNYNGYNISCNGLTDGSINLTVNGGVPTYSYSWNNGSSSQNLSPLGAGTYSVIITDMNNCKDTSQITLTEPPVLVSSVASVSNYNGFNISCNGLTDGNIDINVTGGVTTYSYTWSNGTSTQDQTNIGAGTYSVVIADANNCMDTLSFTLTQAAPLTSSITATSNYNGYNISCNGLSDGNISLTVNGGVTTYSYTWSNGSTSQNLSSIGAGTYSVIITDMNNCKDTSQITLTEPAVLISSVVSVSNYNGYNISCNGLTDGSIDINVTGGVTTYSYTWSNGTSTQDQTSIGAGTYSVVIADANSCKDTLNFTLTQAAPLTSSITATSNYNGYNISCNGLNDGSLSLNVNGGVTTYSYSWSNGSTSQNLFSIGAGTYSVIITDANNCTSTSLIILTEPAPLTSSITATSNYNGYNISCFGLSDGSIGLTVNGGVTTYSYSWSNGSTTQNLSSIAAGTYSVLVTDMNNCTGTSQITLTEPAVLVSSLVSLSNYNGYNISCNGLTDGNIDINVTGGVTTYSYIWSNGTSTQDQTNIGAGTYSVVVTDANSCTNNLSFTLTQAAPLTSSITATSNYNGYNISCFGLSDGGLSLTVNGGVTTYSYSWSNGSSSQNLSSIGAGTYTVVVTDANNCTSTSQMTLTQPTGLISSIASESDYNGFNISCNGLTDGNIDITIAGGVTSYSYAWSNGTSTQDQTNIGAGTYSVVITDANNCQNTLSTVLTEPAPLKSNGNVASDYNGYSVSCHGSTNGMINVNTTGGVQAYVFTWSNGSSSQNQTGIGAGTYSVVITDQNSCADTLQFTLNQPDSIIVTSSIQNVPCNGFHNGSIDINASGGVAPILYSWSNGATSQDISGISSGTYTVMLLDANNCPSSHVYTVTETTPIVINLSHTNVTCSSQQNGSITSSVSGGTSNYSYQWSNGSTQTHLDNIGPGTYILTITDNYTCTKKDTAVITEPNELTVSLSSPVLQNGHNVSLYHAADGSITATVSGGTAPYTFSWSNGATTQNLSNIPAGTYTLVVTDKNGCTATAQITLTEPLSLAMPNGISPNGDGLNDYFVVHGIEAYPNNNINVFNRWGNNVYEKDNYANMWAGKNKAGADLPDGTYFVILKINNGDITLTGYVDIRR